MTVIPIYRPCVFLRCKKCGRETDQVLINTATSEKGKQRKPMNAKSVEEPAPEVEEKLAIHGLEEKVKAKRAAVEQLESKEMDLEKILKETTSVAPAGTQQPKQPKTMENKKKKRKWVLSAIKARAFEDH